MKDCDPVAPVLRLAKTLDSAGFPRSDPTGSFGVCVEAIEKLHSRLARNQRGRVEQPLWFSLLPWLRGSDLNRRPLGYEYNTAMSGNPLILREKRSAASGSPLSDDASFFVSFHPVSGCYGSKMGAEIRAQSPRLSAGAGDLATAILVPVRPPTLMTT